MVTRKQGDMKTGARIHGGGNREALRGETGKGGTMNHEIMIPFNFDTSFIEKKLQDDGYSEVLGQLVEKAEKEMMRQLPTKGGNYDTWRKSKTEEEIDWRGLFERRLDRWFGDWISEHGQEIVDEAALLMAKRGASRKAWREVLTEYQEEQD